MEKPKRHYIIKTLYHMKERCYNKDVKGFENWGGRGITICDEWLNNSEAFVSWALANGYQRGLTIDRIDNDGNYCPENCQWVTIKENNQHRRSTRFFAINGETKNLQQWCDIYGLPRSMVEKRLSLGWDIEKALNTPKKKRDTESLVGKKFGRLTVVRFVGVGSGRKSRFECVCDCGNTVVVDRQKLLSGHTKSCGCIRQEKCAKISAFKRD